jgi:hypothetical protein
MVKCRSGAARRKLLYDTAKRAKAVFTPGEIENGIRFSKEPLSIQRANPLMCNSFGA